MPSAVVVLGGFLTQADVYAEMRDTLAELTGREVFVVPVSPRHWATTVSESGWERILLKLDDVVRAACAAAGDRVTLVAHSAGGVLGRLYLSPEPFRGRRFQGLEKVEHLITLGSPHLSVRGARIRRWVHRTYPGARFSPDVAYTAVAGRALQGDRRGSLKQRVAYRLYRHLCDDGTQWGDGLVPLVSARLEGARNLVSDGTIHAPLPGGSWYGTAPVVRSWWEEAIAPTGNR